MFLLLLTAALTGCGGSGGGAKIATANGSTNKASSTTAASKLSNQDLAVKFGRCMRANGIPDFKDPEVDQNGGMRVELPTPKDGKLVAKKVIDAAMEKCKQYLPDAGKPRQLDPKQLEQTRQFSVCMRAHGLPKFPDPDANGGIKIDGNAVGGAPGDPKFDAAQKACRKYMPGGGTDTQTRNDG